MMSNYKGAMYIGNDPIHLWDGSLIMKGDITELISEEAACNDNNFEPFYGEKKKKEKAVEKKPEPKKSKKRGKK
jgi:hypothetical protein